MRRHAILPFLGLLSLLLECNEKVLHLSGLFLAFLEKQILHLILELCAFNLSLLNQLNLALLHVYHFPDLYLSLHLLFLHLPHDSRNRGLVSLLDGGHLLLELFMHLRVRVRLMHALCYHFLWC